MRLYIGTLHSGENEFNECVKSILSQNYTDFEHFVFAGLPQKQAHEILFNEYLGSDFDLLVKVDADMVLTDMDFFGKVVSTFMREPSTQLLQAAAYDFFSETLVWGINTYNDFTWKPTSLFTDNVIHAAGLKIITETPVANHCSNPSLLQAFHYGAHKAIKIQQNGMEVNKRRSEYHRKILIDVIKSYNLTQDLRRGFCILGALVAAERKLELKQIDYTNPYFVSCFEEYANFDNEQVKEATGTEWII